MIGTLGQWILQFDIESEGLTDFLQAEDLITFVLREQAGNKLPSFEFQFKTNSTEVVAAVLKDGAAITAMLGVDLITAPIYVRLTPTEVVKTADVGGVGRGVVMIHIIGLLNSLGYFGNQMLSLELPSSMLMPLIVSPYFKYKTNIAKSEDEQYWVQPNISTQKFVEDIWLHSFVPAPFNFQAVGITVEGWFKFFNIPLLAAEEPRYIFTPDDAEDTTRGLDNRLSTGTMVPSQPDWRQLDGAREKVASLIQIKVAERNEQLAELRSVVKEIKQSEDTDDLTALMAELQESYLNDVIPTTIEDFAWLLVQYYTGGLISKRNLELAQTALRAIPQLTQQLSTLRSLDWDNLKNVLNDAGAQREDGPEEVSYAELVTESKFGVLNLMAGTEPDLPTHLLESGVDVTLKPIVLPLLAESVNTGPGTKLMRKTRHRTMQTRNQHAFYHEAHETNLANLLMFSSLGQQVLITNKMFPIEVLDLVELIVRETDQGTLANGPDSGGYIVTEVKRVINSNTMWTFVRFNREGLIGGGVR